MTATYVDRIGPEGFLPHALAYCKADWPVFPLAPRSKVPLVAGGHGHLDGTTDPDVTRRRWEAAPFANIGARVPDGLVVLDVDPRHGGFDSLRALEECHGALPPTLTSWTGSGGVHLFYGRPPGELRQSAHKLGRGLDVKLGGKGYVVLPPSIHPNGQLYQWCPTLRPVVPLSEYVAELLRPPPEPPARPPCRPGLDGPRPGDQFNAVVSWREILEPAGWVFLRQQGDVGYWRRPGKDDGQSATTNALGTDRLHVFTSSAPPFEADTSYSKFGAWALLVHQGDYAAAARALRGVSCSN